MIKKDIGQVLTYFKIRVKDINYSRYEKKKILIKLIELFINIRKGIKLRMLCHAKSHIDDIDKT